MTYDEFSKEYPIERHPISQKFGWERRRGQIGLSQRYRFATELAAVEDRYAVWQWIKAQDTACE
jgi:hypothetical protein